MPDTLTISNVSYTIKGKKILDDISLSVIHGSITGILGPNGAGKSTLLAMITNLKNPSRGQVLLFENQHPGMKQARQRIGVVFQETALYEDITVYENLAFAASLYNVANPKKRITEVLEILKLSERTNDFVKTLSGGLQRRVAIARAFLHNPDLLIIDEPTLGVDVEARHAIWSHLRLLKSQGKTILVATNYLDEAQALCDTVIVLHQGRLIAKETPQELTSRVGSCIDFTCTKDEGQKISKALDEEEQVIRTEEIPNGISVFVKGNAVPEKIITIAAKKAKIHEFRVRAPDLAEVFKAIQPSS